MMRHASAFHVGPYANPNKQHGEHRYFKELSRTLHIIYLISVTQKLSYE